MEIYKVREYIKKHKISYGYIKEETGYSFVHISNILNGKKPASDRFMLLLIPALERFALKNLNDLQTHLEGTPWKALLSYP